MPARRRPISADNLKTTRHGDVKRRGVLWRWRRVFFAFALVAVSAVAGAGYVVSRIELPTTVPDEDQTTFICPAGVAPGQCTEQRAIASFHGEEDRVNVSLDQVPDVVINAVISAEDRDFFEHGGVDPVGITRAALSDIRGNSAARQGGSTITQQYVKNVYLTNERTLDRKIREAVMAIKLEQEISKEQILENYLNTIYFGRGAYGIQAASQAYFAKDVGAVTLPEAALLAGLIRSPQGAEPYRHPEEARRRRRTVLDAMLEEGYITREERDLSDAWEFDVFHGLALWTPSDGVDVAPSAEVIGTSFFIEEVRKQLTERYGSDAVFGGGLRVYTTIDMGAQTEAFRSVVETLDQPDDPAGALVSIDDQGRVVAMMGGRDYAGDKVNLALGKRGGGSGRQPGSTFKAFAVAEAVREGYSIESLIRSPSVETFEGADAGRDWTVRGGCCGGLATLEQATARSANTAFVDLMLDLGVENVAGLANDLGVTADFEGEGPALVLGSGEVSVLDMAAGYSTFANQGTAIEPRMITRVERADGSLVEEFSSDRREVLTVDEAALVTHTLRGVIEGGTGTAADIGRPAAGKTGTTSDNKDAWFVGYTPGVTTAVWMGYAIPREMTSVHGETVAGGNIPARIWKRYMETVLVDVEPTDFTEPDDLEVGRPLDEGLGAGSSSPSSGSSGGGTPGGGTGGTGDTGGTGGGGGTDDDDTDDGDTDDGDTDGGGGGGGGGPTTPTVPLTQPSTPASSVPAGAGAGPDDDPDD